MKPDKRKPETIIAELRRELRGGERRYLQACVERRHLLVVLRREKAKNKAGGR